MLEGLVGNFAGERYRIKNEVPEHKKQGAEDDEETQPERHIGVARYETLQETGHDEDGHHAYHDLEAADGAALKRIDAAVGTGKEQAVSEHESRRAGDDNGGDLEAAVYPHHQQGLA